MDDNCIIFPSAGKDSCHSYQPIGLGPSLSAGLQSGWQGGSELLFESRQPLGPE